MAAAKNSYEFLEPGETSDELGRLGHYRVLRELGRGGMGFVFQAEDVKLKRSVALKVMNQKIAATAGSRQRFISEARAMAAIRHDNVATIFEVGQRNDTPFMAMEMLAGETVEQFNRRGALPDFRDVIRYARQIAQGLQAAHQRGIVHRDIKPANIWIEAEIDRIKILDFGLALASTPVDSLAGRGSVIGTPGYLSPEQARTEPLDDRSDLYSLGAVLYEMCTGKLPIGAKSVHEQLIAILIQKPRPISDFNPDIPDPLCQLIGRLLKKEPRARIGSAGELIEQLDSVASECERSTEVAQTIDRLKNELTSVLDKKAPLAGVADSMPVANPFDDVPATVPGAADPFSAVPDPLAVAPAAAGGSGVIAAVPMDSSGAVPAAGMKRTAPTSTPSATPGGAYLPLAIVVLVAVIALPLMTFAFTGFGRSSENVVISPEPGQAAPVANPPTPRAPAGNPSSKPNGKKQGNSAGKKNGGKQAGGNNRPPVKSGGKPQPGKPNQGNPPSAGKSASKPSPPPTKPQPQPKPSPPKPTAKTVPPAPTAKPANANTTPSPPPKKEVPSRWVQLSTADGGADAMVQSGSTERYGVNNAIGVRTRGGVETNHSYLGFNVKAGNVPLDRLVDAQLAISFVGATPTGGKLRLYGVSQNLEWPEKIIIWKNSFSPQGLDNLTLLAETTIAPSNVKETWLRFGSTELTDFIKNGKYDFLTLVLSGEYGDQMIRMVSKEKNPDRAPKLGLRVTESQGK